MNSDAASIASDRAPEPAARTPLGALRELSRDSFTYLLGAAALGLGNFLLIPLYTRHLTPSEFGVYALVDVTLMVLVVAAGLKFDVSYLKWFADSPAERRPRLIG